ncbi:MAG: hypothetical protein EON60_00175 [Alphaproteobacteria bacterium]|nr:MAG: hypothetical protein EON60_00175 [Alphaproteobacteria bacterium]
MKWEKKGLICSHETLDLPWYKKNTMVPVPYLVDETRLRIFVAMCDEQNVGRIGYVDVDPADPSRIIDYSRTPLIDIGEDGCFDDNGVVTASLLKDGDKLYMYYSGYQLCVKVPYLIFAGVAVSEDNGNTFTKLSTRVPIIDRTHDEAGTRCVPFVVKEDGLYKMWYTADSKSGWIEAKGKKMPLYDLKYTTSHSPIDWSQSTPPELAVTFANTDEHGIAKCTLWKEDDLYKIIYSIRSLSQGYRLGYGESTDGIHFTRKDEEVGIDVSETGWDSEMIAFAERIEVNGKVYLFYCGNHYGMAGMGYAELIKE